MPLVALMPLALVPLVAVVLPLPNHNSNDMAADHSDDTFADVLVVDNVGTEVVAVVAVAVTVAELLGSSGVDNPFGWDMSWLLVVVVVRINADKHSTGFGGYYSM